MFSERTLKKMWYHKVLHGKKSRIKELNLVARLLPTPKGELLKAHTASGVVELGCKGGGAVDPYEIREAAPHVQGKFRLYCNCSDQKIRKGYGNPCKHIDKLLLEFSEFEAADRMFTSDLIIYDPDACRRALKVIEEHQIFEASLKKRDPFAGIDYD